MWKNILDPNRPQMRTSRRMRFACWITKATDIHSEYVTFLGYSWQQWLSERTSVLHIRTFPVL